MKTPTPSKVLTTIALLALPMLASAANITLTGADASGATYLTSSFTAKGFWNDTVGPNAANDYYTGVFGMRTPQDTTNYVFQGNSLTLQTPSTTAYSIIDKDALGSGATVTYTINNLTNAGGLLRSGGTVGHNVIITGNGMTVTAPSTIVADQVNWIINSPLVGSSILTNNFASSQLITYGGNNTNFTGKLVISGIVLFSATNAVPANPVVSTPSQITLAAGGTLRDNIGISLNNANGGITLNGAGTINTVNLTTNTIISEPITGAFTLTKSGAGTLTLSGSNSMTGLTLSGATVGSQLNINSTNALGTGLFTINSGDLAKIDNTSGASLTLIASNAQSWGNNFTFIGSTNLNLGTGPVTLVANRTVTNLANTLTVGGSISGAFTLTKAGAGTLVLTASNTFTGGLTISGGTLVMGNTNALGTNGMTFGNGSTLDIATDGGDYTNVVNAGSSSSWTTVSDVKTGTTGINHTLGTFLIGSGSPALQMNVVRSATLTGGSPQITASAMTLSGGTGGTTILNPTTAPLSIGPLTASATSKLLQLDGTNTANTITGPITDGGANTITLVKTNLSTWTLSGASTYSGNTTIAQGTLAIGGGGSLTSANVSISSGGTLDISASTYTLGASQILSGNGNVAGNFADNTGSQIAPGGLGTIGTLTFNNNLTLAVSDTNKFDFTSSTNDLIVVNGSLNPSVGTVINLASLPAGGLPNGTYTLMQVSGTLGGAAGNFSITGTPSPSRQTFSIVYDSVSSPKRVLLQVSGSAASLVWAGTASPWDIVTTKDWTNGVVPDFYFDGDNVSFTDLGSALSPVLNTSVQPGSVAFNSGNSYSLTGNGAISGSTALTKSGGGTLTITTTNGYTGVTVLNGGTVSVNTITNGGIPSPIGAATSASANLAFGGGICCNTQVILPPRTAARLECRRRHGPSQHGHSDPRGQRCHHWYQWRRTNQDRQRYADPGRCQYL